MLAIRFLRTGKKNQPFFRIIVTDKRKPPRGGGFLEILGFFNPRTKEKNLRKERIKYWLSVGARPSPRVHNLLVREKIIEGKKIDVQKKKREGKVKEEKPKEETKPKKAAKEEKPKEAPSVAETPKVKKEGVEGVKEKLPVAKAPEKEKKKEAKKEEKPAEKSKEELKKEKTG